MANRLDFPDPSDLPPWADTEAQNAAEQKALGSVARLFGKLIVVAFLGLIAALLFSGCFLLASTGPTPAIDPVAKASPSPLPSPSASPTASPANPCAAPVTGVNLGGPTSVPIGEVFKIHVTPVNASGPLEGALDYCNNGRVPIVESMSANLRCSGACSGFGPQFLAQGVGPFTIRIRVDNVSELFAGTVTR